TRAALAGAASTRGGGRRAALELRAGPVPPRLSNGGHDAEARLRRRTALTASVARAAEDAPADQRRVPGRCRLRRDGSIVARMGVGDARRGVAAPVRKRRCAP